MVHQTLARICPYLSRKGNHPGNNSQALIIYVRSIRSAAKHLRLTDVFPDMHDS